jgi:predicted metalloendopeptidase
MFVWVYQVLSGQAVQKNKRWKMASVLDNYLGEALGELYVKVFLKRKKECWLWLTIYKRHMLSELTI